MKGTFEGPTVAVVPKEWQRVLHFEIPCDEADAIIDDHPLPLVPGRGGHHVRLLSKARLEIAIERAGGSAAEFDEGTVS